MTCIMCEPLKSVSCQEFACLRVFRLRSSVVRLDTQVGRHFEALPCTDGSHSCDRLLQDLAEHRAAVGDDAVMGQVKVRAPPVCNRTSQHQPRPVTMVECFRLSKRPLGPCHFGLVHAVDDDGQHTSVPPARQPPQIPIQHSIVVLVPGRCRRVNSLHPSHCVTCQTTAHFKRALLAEITCRNIIPPPPDPGRNRPKTFDSLRKVTVRT